ncbi:MAG: Hsp20 family protein [Gammaproteobacteria bacterium]|nr:Hsp20 family protein [Gammaproteobacteria bacterium]
MQAFHYNPSVNPWFSSRSLSRRNSTNRENHQELAHNLIAVDEQNLILVLAVPGFEKNELDIQLEKNTLTIHGNTKEDDNISTFIHQGITKATFKKQFQLDKNIEIGNAKLKNGLLHISLIKNIPEELKPQSISIQCNDDNH